MPAHCCVRVPVVSTDRHGAPIPTATPSPATENANGGRRRRRREKGWAGDHHRADVEIPRCDRGRVCAGASAGSRALVLSSTCSQQLPCQGVHRSGLLLAVAVRGGHRGVPGMSVVVAVWTRGAGRVVSRGWNECPSAWRRGGGGHD